MKRVLVILLMLVLVLTACSSKTNEPVQTAAESTTGSESVAPVNEEKKLDYPTKPIELIVPYAAGGGTHLAAELLSPDAQEYLGQPLSIVCKPGAGGAIGATYAANAKADGYTLLYHTFSLPATIAMGDADFPAEQLVGIAQASSVAPVIAVRADAPYNNAEELIAWANEHPGEFTWSFPGIGSSLHICGANAINAMGIKDITVEVPFDGTAEGIAAVLGGHVNAISCFTTSLTEQLKAGEMKIIGVQSSERIAEFPEAMTFVEQGIDAKTTSWRGVFAPAGTPQEILDYLDVHLGELIMSDTYLERANNLGEGRAYKNMSEFNQQYLDDANAVVPLLDKLGLLNN